MKKILPILFALLSISCGGDDDEGNSECPCNFTGQSIEMQALTDDNGNSGEGITDIYLNLPLPCNEYLGEEYTVDGVGNFIYLENGQTINSAGVLVSLLVFIMDREWINAINSSGTVNGYNITLTECIDSSY